MKFSYRTKLTILVVGLTFAAILGSTAFFLNLYIKDKLAYVFDTELANTIQLGSNIKRLLNLAADIDSSRLENSSDLIMLWDGPCNTGQTALPVFSHFFDTYFSKLQLDPVQWALETGIQQKCGNVLGSGTTDRFTFVSSTRPFVVPYLLAYTQSPRFQNRVVALSMDGLTGTGVSSTLIVKPAPAQQIVWSDNPNLDTLLNSLKIPRAELFNVSQRALSNNMPTAMNIGEDGIVKVAPLDLGLAIVSVSSKSQVLSPVYYVIAQSLLLMSGFLFLCLFIGKFAATTLSRPLMELAGAAERVGAGDFSHNFELSESKDETGVVKQAFNTMTAKIGKLLEDTKAQAEIESEMALTQKVQQMLLPKDFLKVEDHEIYSFVKMAQKCGGDWWGYAPIKKSHGIPMFLLLIGDVTGHGISSALITASAQGSLAILRDWIDKDPAIGEDPRLVLKHFNRAVCESSGGNINMTFFAAVVDCENAQLCCSNAAHNKQYLILPASRAQADKPAEPAQIIAVGEPGPTLGASIDSNFSDAAIHPWVPGAQLFMYTDGLIDVTKNGLAAFERKDLVKVLKRNVNLKGKALLDAVLKERFKASEGTPQEDDITALVCKAPEKLL